MMPKERREAIRARVVASLTGLPEDIRERVLRAFDRQPTSEQLADLLDAISRLPAPQRRVFTLRYSYGMQADEIAERMSMTSVEVEENLAAAFATVRALIAPLIDDCR